jgi:hypothetical protein
VIDFEEGATVVPYTPYRGPLVNTVTTEPVPPADAPPPFYRVGPDDPNFPELRAWADKAVSDAPKSVEPGETVDAAFRQGQLEDAQQVSFDAEHDRELALFNQLLGDGPDDPPPSAPSSAEWWSDEEDDGLDALRPTG